MASTGNSCWAYSRRITIGLGLISWATSTALEVLTALDAVSLRSGSNSYRSLAFSAVALTGSALLCLSMLLILSIRRKDENWLRSRRQRIAFVSISASISNVSFALTLAYLIITRTNYRGKIPAAHGSWPGQTPANFVVLGFATLSQILFYTSSLFPGPAASKFPVSSLMEEARDSVVSETQESGPPLLTLQVLNTPFSKELTIPSPTLSIASSIRNSWRSSVQQIVRPVTSRTKLLSRPSSSRDTHSLCSDSRSVSTISHDGFDSWDTSQVGPHVRDALLQSGLLRGTALTPIPGSRPVSPACALDGPFPLASSARVSAVSLAPPPVIGDGSRPPSPALSEAHIHPLFRTDSPVPPPAATPGTVVTASPYGGQAIHYPSRNFSRVRPRSRTASPSMLGRRSHIQDSTPDRHRSSSPPSRETTPPIPEFILAATPRNSLGGHGMRKVSLNSESSKSDDEKHDE